MDKDRIMFCSPFTRIAYFCNEFIEFYDKKIVDDPYVASLIHKKVCEKINFGGPLSFVSETTDLRLDMCSFELNGETYDGVSNAELAFNAFVQWLNDE